MKNVVPLLIHVNLILTLNKNHEYNVVLYRIHCNFITKTQLVLQIIFGQIVLCIESLA